MPPRAEEGTVRCGVRELRAADRRFHAETIQLFHSYLSHYVVRASPLLLDLTSLWGLDLTAALRRLRPPKGWPYFEGRRGARRSHLVGKGTSCRWRAPERSFTRPVACGEEDAHRVSLCLDIDTIQVRLWLGDALCSTRGDMLEIWLPIRIPETVQLAMTGRPLSILVDHPVLRMREYRVLSSRSAGRHTVVRAEAMAVPFAMPW